ncbi:MAG: hypothetical protein Edafosvirus15_16 [Edafosvirus sp.]|uniref:Uncharacterized protein n=1 Tax=Edafosvirus sp. TaxID=2487765 RepID=A0A3G4ZUC7_9VIRU|nr:MAG: hypothetical protein Edafosvirus15_16 [Edafosvirus sp.]
MAQIKPEYSDLLHILIAVLLFYVGYSECNSPKWAFQLLIVLAVLIVIWFLYRLFNRRNDGFAGTLRRGPGQFGLCSFDQMCVEIRDDLYNPQNLQYYFDYANGGTTVYWKNMTSVPQNIIIREQNGDVLVDSGNIAPGQGFNYQFTVPGLYKYTTGTGERWMAGQIDIIDFDVAPLPPVYNSRLVDDALVGY